MDPIPCRSVGSESQSIWTVRIKRFYACSLLTLTSYVAKATSDLSWANLLETYKRESCRSYLIVLLSFAMFESLCHVSMHATKWEWDIIRSNQDSSTIHNGPWVSLAEHSDSRKVGMGQKYTLLSHSACRLPKSLHGRGAQVYNQ